MTFQLPAALATPDNEPALTLLMRYYGNPLDGPGSAVGAAFDRWDSTSTRAADADRFTADDLVAVTLLSVKAPPAAAKALLDGRANEFAKMLDELGSDRDLVDEPHEQPDDWAGWQLMNELRSIPGVNTTIASKLLARKRPRLRPIWDTVVAEVTGTKKHQWEPLRVALRADDQALHNRLLRLRDAVGLPDSTSALRVFDVICWREGKDRGL
jgi:Family of unknown function (DUF6308)